jgi:predicted ATPase
VFAGMNGTGKSTVIQSLLAIRQSWQSDSLARGRIQLNGGLTELGTAREVYCADPCSDWVEIILTSSAKGAPIELRSTQLKERSQDYFFSLDTAIQFNGDFTTFGLFSEPFNYLHAERVGPRKVSPIPVNEEHALSVGKSGENASYIVASTLRETRVMNENLILESSDEKEYRTLHYQWMLWLARIFPGFDGKSEIYNEADQVRLGLALQRRQTGQSLFVRPTNTGFGISYVLGIIVAGLVSRPNTILIVENPEAHLHPKAQSMLGEFLARVAAAGTQVLVETHSEHVLNGIRRMVKQTLLTPDKVRFLFFGRALDTFEPAVIHVPVTATGDISKWPDGFFDQLDKDLSLILT